MLPSSLLLALLLALAGCASESLDMAPSCSEGRCDEGDWGWYSNSCPDDTVAVAAQLRVLSSSSSSHSTTVRLKCIELADDVEIGEEAPCGEGTVVKSVRFRVHSSSSSSHSSTVTPGCVELSRELVPLGQSFDCPEESVMTDIDARVLSSSSNSHQTSVTLQCAGLAEPFTGTYCGEEGDTCGGHTPCWSTCPDNSVCDFSEGNWGHCRG